MSDFLIIFSCAAFLNNWALRRWFDLPLGADLQRGSLQVAAAVVLASVAATRIFPDPALTPDLRRFLLLFSFAVACFALTPDHQPTGFGSSRLWRRWRQALPLLVAAIVVCCYAALQPTGAPWTFVFASALGLAAACAATQIFYPPLRDRIESADVPASLRGWPVSLLGAGGLALALAGVGHRLPW